MLSRMGFLVGLVFGLIACSGGGGGGGGNPAPLSEGNLDKLSRTMMSANMAGGLPSAFVDPDESDTTEIARWYDENPDASRMWEMLQACEKEKIETDSSVLKRVFGANCPVDYRLEAAFTGGGRLSGKLSYQVKDEEYRGLNDVDRFSGTVSGSAPTFENSQMTWNLTGNSQTYGVLSLQHSTKYQSTGDENRGSSVSTEYYSASMSGFRAVGRAKETDSYDHSTGTYESEYYATINGVEVSCREFNLAFGEEPSGWCSDEEIPDEIAPPEEGELPEGDEIETSLLDEL